MNLALDVNGKTYNVTVSSSEMPLLWVVRDLIGLTGTKYGCGVEICGACTMLIDGRPQKTCQMSVSSAVGHQVTTIEGLSADRSHPAQLAWIEYQVPQCGYCQSGMLLKAAASLSGAGGDDDENLCVCGTYQRINQALASLGIRQGGN
jgi:isoquinoline 1-oxidoreductase alpha subunit